jgi:hypothetical protein
MTSVAFLRADIVRPYEVRIDSHDPMAMVGHDREFIIEEADFLADICRSEPFIFPSRPAIPPPP